MPTSGAITLSSIPSSRESPLYTYENKACNRDPLFQALQLVLSQCKTSSPDPA
uniref:Uncharacterized protein n=1 Tax=Anguilla anguilla TaxID=7936 RepID=A0A0E9T8R7_ANGAN